MASLLNDDTKGFFDEYEDEVCSLWAVLAKRTWIGFDLDDTLHEFRRASSNATSKVLDAISTRYGTPVADLKAAYSVILKQKTSDAFSDGRTSFDYRRERFAAVLCHFLIPLDDEFLGELLQTYETTLTDSLELKSGAINLLSAVKKMGKKVVVITEGPQDAQERTIKCLGIDEYIDFLATTNRFGASKTSGLFPKVLEHLGITASDLLYVGDSQERDMEPAMAAGIFSIHYAEGREVSWNSHPPRIDTLGQLEYALSSGHKALFGQD